MIIDTHYHMMHRFGRGTARVLARWTFETAKKLGINLDFETLAEQVREDFADPDGEKLLTKMDADGIDVTVFCAVDNAAIKGSTQEVANTVNEQTGAIARRHRTDSSAWPGSIRGVPRRRTSCAAVSTTTA